jgi:hypothetical protein
MPSAALRQKVSTMQQEAALLDAHARVLSTFAQELSSFASTLAFLSNSYLGQSDMLGEVADRIMAGGPAMEFLVNCDTDSHVVVPRVTRQAALAAVTNDARDFVRRTLHNFTITLADRGEPEVKVENIRSPKRKRLLLEKGRCELDHGCRPIARGDGYCEDAMHTLKRHCHGTDNYTYSSSPFASGAHPMSDNSTSSATSQLDLVRNTSEGCNEIPALDPGWRNFSDSWKAWSDEDESGERSGGTSDEMPVAKPSSNSSESGNSDIYVPVPSPEEEEKTLPDKMEEESDTIWGFVRNPYELATRTAWMGESSVSRSFILEAAERAANPNLASLPLVNCAAAFI